MMRGIRGAITVNENSQSEILNKTEVLLRTMIMENNVDVEDIGAVIFSSTPDLNVAFPAQAARNMGWTDVPLFGTQEIENPYSVPKCIRILILWNTELPQKQIKHIYLEEAIKLRQDIK